MQRAWVRSPFPSDSGPSGTTLTTTATTIVDGSPSTVVVTIVTTVTNNPDPVTRTTTRVVTKSESTTGGAGAPFRPTLSETDDADITTIPGAFCPTGFYACLARAGGGCCQTGRDCKETSCPPTPMTTIINNGVTIAVPVADVPASNSATCANGWFMCGDEGGPVAGCCPDGYSCGTASCTLASPTETSRVQKQLPDSAASTKAGSLAGLVVAAGLFGVLHLSWA
ncbi:unnamed protein product [Parascedosporium putredinis]|uniref:GPI anchored protein n=1 Tax=Parascedosporium putredinis TaxID=1442378 RepID=A0A9P1M9F8_9PEZI|nr:unnamed protein product [Parascedosporium putredinis]CAI7995583.1 unnamed protein product [Parascedosporium putredinis]